MSTFTLHIILCVVFLIAFSVMIYSIFSEGSETLFWFTLVIAILCGFTGVLTEEGEGLLAHLFYSEPARAKWVAQSQLGKKSDSFRVVCPKAGEWEKWSGEQRQLWRELNAWESRHPWARVEGCYSKFKVD